MAGTKVRVPGGGNTFIVMGNSQNDKERLAFLANFTDRPGQAVGRATPIHPIGSAYPVEIAVPYAQGMGTLTLTVWSLWGVDGWVSAFYKGGDPDQSRHSLWNKFAHKHGNVDGQPVDLYEVLKAQRELDGYLFCQKYERGANGEIARIKTYNKCVITDIDATDNVTLEQMEQRVTITCNYAYVTVASGKTQYAAFTGYDISD